MECFEIGKTGRLITICFQRGELLLEGLLGALKDHGIKNAVLLGAIGSLQKVHYHRVLTMEEEPQDEYLTLEAPCEISAAQGIVLDGSAHFHFVFSDLKTTYSGHLEPGTEVLYLVEATLAEIPECEVKRLKNEQNIAYFAK